jgi:hypothetical protein
MGLFETAGADNVVVFGDVIVSFSAVKIQILIWTSVIESDFRPRHHSQTQASSDSRPLSQSEHDWAYAKRALARGDDPEEVIRRIADYRGSEKHDPESYARRTVTKAKVELYQRPVNAGGGGGHAPQSGRRFATN